MPETITIVAVFEAAVQKHAVVCAHFGAAWCPPCTEINSMLDGLKPTFPAVAFIYIDSGHTAACVVLILDKFWVNYMYDLIMVY